MSSTPLSTNTAEQGTTHQIYNHDDVVKIITCCLNVGFDGREFSSFASSCLATWTAAIAHPRPGASLLLSSGKEGTRLHCAVAHRDSSRLKFLLDKAVPKTAARAIRSRKGDYGKAIGYYVLGGHDVQCLRALLNAGATLQQISGLSPGCNPPTDVSVFTVLDGYPITLPDGTLTGETELHNDNAMAECLTELKNRGATAIGKNYAMMWNYVGRETAGGNSLIHLALRNGTCGPKSMKILIELSGDSGIINYCSPLSGTPLAATLVGMREHGGAIAKVLLDAGAQIASDSLDTAPLILFKDEIFMKHVFSENRRTFIGDVFEQLLLGDFLLLGYTTSKPDSPSHVKLFNDSRINRCGLSALVAAIADLPQVVFALGQIKLPRMNVQPTLKTMIETALSKSKKAKFALVAAARMGSSLGLSSLRDIGILTPERIDHLYTSYTYSDYVDCHTLVTAAAQGGHFEALKILIECGGSVNGILKERANRDSYGSYGCEFLLEGQASLGDPLWGAIASGSFDCVQLLLNSGASLEHFEKPSWLMSLYRKQEDVDAKNDANTASSSPAIIPSAAHRRAGILDLVADVVFARIDEMISDTEESKEHAPVFPDKNSELTKVVHYLPCLMLCGLTWNNWDLVRRSTGIFASEIADVPEDLISILAKKFGTTLRPPIPEIVNAVLSSSTPLIALELAIETGLLSVSPEARNCDLGKSVVVALSGGRTERFSFSRYVNVVVRGIPSDESKLHRPEVTATISKLTEYGYTLDWSEFEFNYNHFAPADPGLIRLFAEFGQLTTENVNKTDSIGSSALSKCTNRAQWDKTPEDKSRRVEVFRMLCEAGAVKPVKKETKKEKNIYSKKKKTQDEIAKRDAKPYEEIERPHHAAYMVWEAQQSDSLY